MFQQVVVPLDGSAESAIALPLARAVTRSTAGTLRLVRVIPPQVEGRPATEATEAATYLSGIAEELTAGGSTVETAVRQGDVPSAALLREIQACGADLVVMATHGRGGLRRAVMGSVAEHVVAESPVPVLLARLEVRPKSRC
jgi:nucleotide-binding universal stress UspA family protein